MARNNLQQSKQIQILIIIILLIGFILPGCSSGPAEGEEVPDDNAPVAIIPTAVSGNPSVEAKYNTWIRGGPGEDYPVYGAFLGGQTAQVTGKNDAETWWVVNIPVAINSQGWVLASAVNPSNTEGVPVVLNPTLPPEVNMINPGPNDPQVTANVETYVRAGPDPSYPAYGIAKAGATGGVLGISEESTYWVVRLDPELVGSGFGWVSVDYVTAKNTENVPVIASPTTHDPVPIEPPPTDTPTVTSIDFLNVRTGPGFEYPVIGVVPPNTSGEAIGVSADIRWYSVRVAPEYYETGQVWVSADWVIAQNTEGLPVIEPPPAPPRPEIPTPEPGAPTLTATVVVNVRSGPGTEYPSYGVAQPGAKGEAIGISEDGEWYAVKLPTTVVAEGIAWVSADYVIAENTGGLPVLPAP